MTKKQQKALVKTISDYLYNGIENGSLTFIDWYQDNENKDLEGIDEHIMLAIELHVENLLDTICEGY